MSGFPSDGLSLQQQEQLAQFWADQMKGVQGLQIPADASEFKNSQLPLARIKKVQCARPKSAAPLCTATLPVWRR